MTAGRGMYLHALRTARTAPADPRPVCYVMVQGMTHAARLDGTVWVCSCGEYWANEGKHP